MIPQFDVHTLTEICKQNGISYLGLFGSMARGDFTSESDVDLLVEYQETPSLLEKGKIINQLQSLFNRDVDLVSKKNVKERLRPYIYKDLKTLYEERQFTLHQ